MEPNYGCSLCPQIAERCCLCSTQRIYLCENCLITHTRKGEYHPLAPLSTPNFITVQTLPQYLEKLKFVTELRMGVEEAIEVVKTERVKLDEIANRVYEKKAKEVYAIYSTMYQEIAQYYEKAVKELENLKREIGQMLEEEQQVSEETIKFIALGKNWKPGIVLEAENLIESAIRVSSEAVSLEGDSYLRRVIKELWVSAGCTQVVIAPSFHSLRGVNRSQDYRLCRNCQRQVHNSVSECPNCSYMEATLFSIPAVPAVSSPRQASNTLLSNPCWECPACHYGYNLESTCSKCSTAKPSSQSAVHARTALSVETQYRDFRIACTSLTELLWV